MTIDELQEPSRHMAELWFIGDLIHQELTESIGSLQAAVDRWEPKPMPANYDGTHKDWPLNRNQGGRHG